MRGGVGEEKGQGAQWACLSLLAHWSSPGPKINPACWSVLLDTPMRPFPKGTLTLFARRSGNTNCALPWMGGLLLWLVERVRVFSCPHVGQDHFKSDRLACIKFKMRETT